MPSVDRATFERVVAAVEPGGRFLAAQRLTGGVSADVHRVELRTAAGTVRPVVVRRRKPAAPAPLASDSAAPSKGEPDAVREYVLLDALYRAGLPVPQPLALLPPDAPEHRPHLTALPGTRESAGPASSGLLVLAWVEGTTQVAAPDLDDALDQLADVLLRLHALDPTIVPADVLAPIEDPTVAVLPLLPATALGARLRARLAERGASEPERRADRCSVVHGDVWPGNVLWHDGRLAAIVDWEDSCLGDPLADLACARVELRCAYGIGAMERFTARYVEGARAAVPALDLEDLPLWDLYVSAAALAAMHLWGLDPVAEATRRTHTEQFFEHAARQLLA